MIARSEGKKLIALAEKFPVVCVTGPRQSGKTTLVKSLFPNHEYVNLENPEEREFARTDPKGFLARVRGAVILDEAQRVPDLFSWLQVDVDALPEPGRFILTGSQQFLMMRSVTQSLAGRVAVLSLFPFTFSELVGRPPFDLTHYDEVDDNSLVPGSRYLNEVLYQGMYPPIHDRGIDVVDWMANYLRTYVERDVRELVNIGDLATFGRFVRLCAGRSGQLLDLSGLGAEAGVSHTTARRWISVLVASGLVLLLAPHHANFNKRLTKTPKLYFIDTGLLCHLLRVRGKEPRRAPVPGGRFRDVRGLGTPQDVRACGLGATAFFLARSGWPRGGYSHRSRQQDRSGGSQIRRDAGVRRLARPSLVDETGGREIGTWGAGVRRRGIFPA